MSKTKVYQHFTYIDKTFNKTENYYNVLKEVELRLSDFYSTKQTLADSLSEIA